MKCLRHVQIDLPAEKDGEVIFDLRQREVRVPLVGLELDEHVDVAIRPEVATKHRTEQREPADMVLSAEVGDALPGNVDACVAHGHGAIFKLSLESGLDWFSISHTLSDCVPRKPIQRHWADRWTDRASRVADRLC